VTTQAAFAGQCLPFDGRLGAIEHTEDLVFLSQDALQTGGCEDEERLKLAEVQQAHDRVDVGGGKENAGDRGMGRALISRGKFRSGKNLRSQVGEAPTRNQTLESGEKAIWVCVRAGPCKVPFLRRPQLLQLQFHCGKPPPAADPRILMRIAGLEYGLTLEIEISQRPNTKAPASEAGRETAWLAESGSRRELDSED